MELINCSDMYAVSLSILWYRTNTSLSFFAYLCVCMCVNGRNGCASVAFVATPAFTFLKEFLQNVKQRRVL